MSYRQHYNTTATTNNTSNSNNTCGNYSTPSNCRTQYGTPYQVVDLATPSSPIQRTPSLSSWTSSDNSFSSPTPSFSRSPTMPALPTPTLSTSYRDPLRSVHGSPRVAKTDHRPLHYQQHHTHHQHESSSETAIPYNRRRSSSSSLQQQPLYDTTNTNNTNVNTIYEDPLANNHRWQSSPSPPSSPRGRYGKNSAASPRRISLATSPRSNGRLPSLFDRIKAALEAPKRPTINTSPLPPIRTNLNLAQSSEQDGLAGCSSPATTTTTTTMPSSHLHSNFTDGDLLNETNDLLSFWCPSVVTKPTLFGIPCTEASQKAYSRHSSDVKASFQRLQLEDCGAVENRTIAFSTHLTISRWEPMPSSTTTNTAATTSVKNPIVPTTTPSTTSSSSASTLPNCAEEHTLGSGSTSKQQQTQAQAQTIHGSHSAVSAPLEQTPLQPERDSPVYAARLISLANYIRHIISLSSGNSSLHSQSTLVQQRLILAQRQQQQLLQQQRQQQKLQESRPSWTTANRPQHDSASLPSPLSAGSGPMKNNSLSTRKHRQTSEYHNHAARRQLHHQQQVHSSASTKDAQGFHRRPDSAEALPSPTSPTFQVGRRSSQPQQQQSHNSGNEQSAAATAVPSSSAGSKLVFTLPKVPFPNLTLTLALIYVDRLKEKNPAAKGEPGCSHRLFLVAYIIAAKYRCCVELATLLQEQYRSDVSTPTTNTTTTLANETNDLGEKGDSDDNKDTIDGEKKSIDQRICKARSRAEVILSNQAWVQLLSLGSFMRPTPPPSTPSTTTVAARTSPSQPMNRSIGSNATGTLESGSEVEAKPLPIQSTPLSANDGASVTQTQTPPPSNSTSPSSPLPPSPPSSILQVEDLNRMESEFLTFLDYDLAARSQDLDTCWGLLVGNKEV